jgi:hypothetical protein
VQVEDVDGRIKSGHDKPSKVVIPAEAKPESRDRSPITTRSRIGLRPSGMTL